MTNTPYNQLRQLLIERLGYKNVTELYERYEIGEPYEEYTLQDVLLAIETNTQGGELHLHIYADKLLIGHYERKNKEGHYSHCYYDLTKPLSDQSDETLLAIIELLK